MQLRPEQLAAHLDKPLAPSTCCTATSRCW
jgi:hypothetical protein